MEERSIDKLARYIIYVAIGAVICGVCWYFKNVLIYIIVAAVISLIGRPIMIYLKKPSIKGKRLPDWFLAIISLVLLFGALSFVITQIVPIVSNIVQSISSNVQSTAINASPKGFNDFLDRINYSLRSMFPALGYGFRIEDYVIDFIKNTFSLSSGISSVSSMLGSVASLVADIGVTLFSVVFISFFFLKDRKLFRNIIAAIVPDKYEGQAKMAIGDIEHLLSRYFVGLIIEVLGVALIDFIGVWTICGLSAYNAMGIAFIAGILNIIPYVGPLTGGVIGTILGMLLKMSEAVSLGIAIHFWPWVFALVAVFLVTQLIDNFIFQPLIYSTSIKSNPLEIFIVLLIAGHIGGIVGMLVAIPSYTVVRVIASEFFYDIKAIRKLIPGKEEEMAEVKVTRKEMDDIDVEDRIIESIFDTENDTE